MIAVIWLFFCSVLYWVVWAAVLLAVFGPVMFREWGELVGLLGLVVAVILLNLPLIALLVSSPPTRRQPPRRRPSGRRRYR